jgi:hypothetical protein
MALMFYLIYKITNNLNNKIYVGSHKTKNKDDGYMGSGKYLNYAINKYGVENFTKEILFIFDNATEMYDKEAEIVNDDFLAEENTYNLKRGGFGGFDYINSMGLSIRNFQNPTVQHVAADSRKQLQVGFYNKVVGDNARQTVINNGTGISNNAALRELGTNAAARVNKDSIWINDGSIVRKINKYIPIPPGWTKGAIKSIK